MFTKNRKMSKSLIVMLLVLSLVLQAFIPIAAFAQSTVYSVAEYMKMTATNAPVTVEGYVVGARASNSFSETTESNLVLGETKTLGSPTEGVTVQLSTTVRDQYSIVKNPALIGQKVRVTGNSENYFEQIGIKGTISLEVVEDTGEPTDPTQPTDPVVPVEPTDITSIADVRAGEQGQVYSVQGTVISKENAWGGNGFYLQDATGGLYIYPGTKQNVTLGNNVILTGTLSSYGGSLQLTAVTAKFDKGTAEVPAATTTTIGTLDTASQHTLVKLENVTVTELTEQNYGTAEFRAEDADGNKVLIRLDNRSGENYTTLSAAYKNGDIINVSGILTTYNSNYQILPFDMTHFEMVTAYEGDPISSEELLTVGQIQGAAHKSPHEGKAVLVKDVVITHVSGNNNYYVQDITPDNDPNTSDAIAVFSRAHGLAVGDQVELVGKVIEYFGAGYADTKRDTDLTITQLEVSKATKVGTAEVPAPIMLDDTSVPKENIKVSDVFDPITNSLDFWEAHEGMLVGLENAKIVGPQRYGDLYVLPSDTTDQLNKLGGYVLKPNQNPNIISILTGNNKLVAKAGDTIEGLITGPVSYAYSAYKLDIPSAKLTIVDGGMKAEQSTIVADENKITVAAYNVENYSAASSTTDAKSQRIANSIVNELGQPDIIALVEMQDNDGQTDSGVTSAQESANRLINDIVTAGGVKYTYGEVAPTNNTSGGAPGANIRVGFIYNEARVTLKSLEAIGTDLPEFQNTRKSLSGTFEFNGQEVLVIGNHFNSKGGDEPLFGSNQPPTLGSVPERLGIAKKVNEYVANKLTATPDLDVVVLGDFNDFEFSEPLTTLEGDILTNLVKNHPVEDRFSYFYQGNSQTLDHILVSNGLVEKATFDMVHINSMFMEEHGRASDHDPVIVQFPVEKEPSNEVKINILHTNDVHGRAEHDASNGVIGYPIYKTIIDEYKAAGNTLVFDAGDAVHGTNFATLSEGESMIKLMNELGIQAMTPGNHEFNYGFDRLKELESQANFQFLASNVANEAGENPFKSGTTFDAEGYTIGVFGLATPETKYKSNPLNTVGIEFTDVVAAAQKEVESLKAKGADVIVLLSHLGMDESSEINTFTVLDAVDGINLVIDGHSHHTLPEGRQYKDTLIASTGSYLSNIGLSTISINKETGAVSLKARLISYEEAQGYTPNSDIQDKIDEYNMANEVVLGQVIGNTLTELDGVRGNVRTKETNLADLITDSMLKETGADVVITNGGGIRASIDAGEITMGEALTVLPFGNLVTVIEVTGQDIADAIKFGAQYYPNANGGFPQIAGATYKIITELKPVLDANGLPTVDENGEPVMSYQFSAIEDITVGGAPIDLTKTYKLATNDFMAVGGDGYTMFEGKTQLSLHGMMVDILANYITELSVDGPFEYTTDGRITVVEKEPSNEVKINILHTNDVHGRAEHDASNGVIGYPIYKTIIDEYKAAGNTLVFDAGDAVHGTNFATLSEGESMIKLMNELGIQAMTPGNHEFNYGFDRLKELESQANFQFLASNVANEAGENPFKSGTTFDAEGYTIGVFGLATPETKYKSNPLNTVGIEFTDVVAAAQKEVESLKAKGADVIVLLSHLGMDESSEINTFTVLDAVDGINLVIDGHSHHTLPEGRQYKDTLIASTGSYLSNIGLSTISINKETGAVSLKARLISYEEAQGYTPNSDIQDKIDEYNMANEVVLGQVIGNTLTELDGVRGNVRTKETNLADLITDSMLKETGADVVITNGGGIRASIDAGEITMGEALTVLPFGNLVTVIEVTGQDIADAIKFGAQYYPNANGGFPQIAGATYKIITELKPVLDANGLPTVDENGEPVMSYQFSAIEDITVGGAPIDLTKTYKLATNDFMAVGGDGYTMFEGKTQLSLHGMMVDILANYITELSVDGPFEYTTDGRITVVEKEPVKVDKTKLMTALEEATSLDITNKTNESVTALFDAIGKALRVYNNPVATQIEVDQAIADLKIAIAGLEDMPIVPIEVSKYMIGTVNVREFPYIESKIIGKIAKGYNIVGTLVSEGSNWVKISENGIEGYVHISTLSDEPIEQLGYIGASTNFRTAPSTTSNIIRVLKPGTPIKGILAPENPGWIKTTIDGIEGYVYASLVGSEEVSMKLTLIGRSNVRAEARIESEIIGTIKKGTIIDGVILTTNMNWVKITFNGQTGYVHSSVVK